jgi:hypothetical protein
MRLRGFRLNRSTGTDWAPGLPFAVGATIRAATAVPWPERGAKRPLIGVVGARREADVRVEHVTRVRQPVPEQPHIPGERTADTGRIGRERI